MTLVISKAVRFFNKTQVLNTIGVNESKREFVLFEAVTHPDVRRRECTS